MTQSISNMSQVWMSNTNTYNSIAMSVSTLGAGANAGSRLLTFKVDGNTKFDFDTSGLLTIRGNNAIRSTGANAQYPIQIAIEETTHPISRRAALDLGGWQIGQDSGGNGNRDFYLYDSSAASVRFLINTSGKINLYNTLHTTGDLITNSGVVSGTVSSSIYYDSNDTNYYINPASTSNLFAANFQRPLFVPRYTLYFDATNASRTTPNTFTKSYTASHVSFGSILGQFFRTFNVGGSFQFEMTVSCSSATSVTSYLMNIDDNVYFFLNGGQIGSATGAGNKNYALTWNLLQGTNIIQIIFNNSGGSDGSINFMADFFQNGNTAFISP